MSQSTEFNWKEGDFEAHYKISKTEDQTCLALEWLTDKHLKILEAGCGTGRVVKYLHDLGYSNVWGIELNEAIVNEVNHRFPELKIVAGDMLDLDKIYGENFFDRVLSFGVVEHFPMGLHNPMKALWRALKPGGIAIVTIPSHNLIRRISAPLTKLFATLREFRNPRNINFVRRVFGRTPLSRDELENPLYYVHPPRGRFFEYRLTPREFEKACMKSGFKILKSVPIAHIDGLYHSCGHLFVKFDKSHWVFVVSKLGTVINNVLTRIPFMHNHMHACILQKV